ncbi:MAG: hypothetical protein M1812_006840 [Candelaria pacifica]|nr:MAG: hypothetical protein M1812_006840 [Candelaria pacifica]
MTDTKVSRDLAPLDLIFSCGVCQDTITEIYAESQDHNGLRTKPGSDEGDIVKLWLTECAHLTCGKHLEGGGAPFHPAKQPPRAPCPVCTAETGGTEPKALYAVFGTGKGQYDPTIPRNYFDTPPIRLDGTAPGMDALRFQYLSLVRYGSRILQKLRLAEREKSNMEAAKDRAAKYSEVLKGQLSTLEGRARELERNEDKLKDWEERAPAIKHYLHILNPLAMENEMLKQQLSFLGYAVPATKYAMELVNDDDLLRSLGNKNTLGTNHTVANGEEDLFAKRAHSESRDAMKIPLVQDHEGPTLESQDKQPDRFGSGRKRKLDDPPEVVADANLNPLGGTNQPSRGLMPPPPRPGATASLSPHKLSFNARAHSDVPNNNQLRSPQKPIFQSQEAQGGLGKPSNEESRVAPTNSNPFVLNSGTGTQSHIGNEATQDIMRLPEGLGSNTRQSIPQQDWQHFERPSRGVDAPSRSSLQTGPQYSSHAFQPAEYLHEVHDTSAPRWPPRGIGDLNTQDSYATHHSRGDNIRPPAQTDVGQQGTAYGSVYAQSPSPHRISLHPSSVTMGCHGHSSPLASSTQVAHSNGLVSQRRDMGTPAFIPHREALVSLPPDRRLTTPMHEAYSLRSRLSTESARNDLLVPTTPLKGGFPSIRKHQKPPESRRGAVRESVSSPFFKSHTPRSEEPSGRSNDLRGRTTQNAMQGWRMAPTASSTSTTLPSLNGLSFITDPRTKSTQQLRTSNPVMEGSRSSHFFTPSTPRPNGYHHSESSSAAYPRRDDYFQYPPTLGRSPSNRANIFSRQVQPLPSNIPSITSNFTSSHAPHLAFTQGDALASVARGGGGGGGVRGLEAERTGRQRQGNEATYGQGFLQRIDDDRYRSGPLDTFSVNARRKVRR